MPKHAVTVVAKQEVIRVLYGVEDEYPEGQLPRLKDTLGLSISQHLAKRGQVILLPQESKINCPDWKSNTWKDVTCALTLSMEVLRLKFVKKGEAKVVISNRVLLDDFGFMDGMKLNM